MLQSPRATTREPLHHNKRESAPQQKLPQDTMKTARATAETWRSQIKKYF